MESAYSFDSCICINPIDEAPPYTKIDGRSFTLTS